MTKKSWKFLNDREHPEFQEKTYFSYSLPVLVQMHLIDLFT